MTIYIWNYRMLPRARRHCTCLERMKQERERVCDEGSYYKV